MKIQENTLVIDEAISDESCDEFIVLIMQPEIERIHLRTNEVASSILQVLLCMQKNRELIVDDPFLAKIFHRIVLPQ